MIVLRQTLALALLAVLPLAAQTSVKGSAKPDPIFESLEFTAAARAGTRTASGMPGARYWQQQARYTLAAEIKPLSKRLMGRGTIRYTNRAPVALPVVYLHINANLFEPGAKKNDDATSLGGMRITAFTVNGTPVDSTADKKKPGYTITGTILELRLATPLASNADLELRLEWNLRIAPEGGPRGGQDNEVWMLSYWYPQMAVYDDITGWQTDPYLGRGEFYMGYADYDVRVTAPSAWLVQATGTLQNADSTLAPAVRERLAQAATSDTVIPIVSAAQRGAGKATLGTEGGTLTWHFTAANVRDVAFGASPFYIWDALSVVVGDRDGDGTPDRALAQALYRPAAARWFWGAAARFTQHAVGVFSKELWPYPYPHMTAFEGPSGCGGMEYPMVTCIGVRNDSVRTYTTVAHEVAHMWFPMQVGSDEKRNAWQDEGFAQYLEGVAHADWTKTDGNFKENRDEYLRALRFITEEPILTPSDKFGNQFSYAVASYYKPVAVFMALRGIIGEDQFATAMREYGLAWRSRHPQPEDFFHSVERVAEKDLRWFWRPWFEETGRLEMAIDTVLIEGDSAEVRLERRGSIAMPIPVQVTRENGSIELITVGESVWSDGRKKYAFVIPEGSSPVRRVRIDAEQRFPYLDRTTHEWKWRRP